MRRDEYRRREWKRMEARGKGMGGRGRKRKERGGRESKK